MRKVFLPFAALISLLSPAQQTPNGRRGEIVEKLNMKFNAELAIYCSNDKTWFTKFMGNNLFKAKLKEVFATVVTTNTNVVSNGSAFAYVKDKDNNSLSVNGSVFVHSFLLDIGASTKSASDNYKFYAEHTWSNDVTGSIGLSWVVHFNLSAGKKKTFLTPCDSLNQYRRKYVSDSIMPKYYKLYSWVYDTNAPRPNVSYPDGKNHTNDDLFQAFLIADARINEIDAASAGKYVFPLPSETYTPPATSKITTTLKRTLPLLTNEITTVDGKKTSERNSFKSLDSELVIVDEPAQADLMAERAAMVKYRNTALELLRLRDNKDDTYKDEAVDAFIDAKLEAFDKKNDIAQGYGIAWFSAKLYLTNSTIAVNNDSTIIETVQEKINHLFKLSAELSFNFSHDVNHFIYLKGFAKFNRYSLLEVQNLKDEGFNITPVLQTVDGANQITGYTINNNNGKLVGDYWDLKRPVYSMDLGVYGAWLCKNDKTLGPTVQAAVNFPYGDVHVYYKNNYTVLAGLLIKTAGENVIINLLGGFENQYFKTNPWDNFVVKASFGVPFTIFEKSKK